MIRTSLAFGPNVLRIHVFGSFTESMSNTKEPSNAQKRWELENEVQAGDTEALYQYDIAEQQALQQQKPWQKDPHYFKQYVTLRPTTPGVIGTSDRRDMSISFNFSFVK